LERILWSFSFCSAEPLLGNSTVLDSTIRAIEQDAVKELNNAMREYNRGIEEIALLERRVKEIAPSFWRKLLGRAAV
jgi:hypothetical protein